MEATVKHGPQVWQGRTGLVIADDGVFVIVQIADRDDAGAATFNVRMPRLCVDIKGEQAPYPKATD
jgi:hypothetical protein